MQLRLATDNLSGGNLGEIQSNEYFATSVGQELLTVSHYGNSCNLPTAGEGRKMSG